MQFLMRVLLEFILGYLLQGAAFIIGMHAVARKKLEWKKAILVTLLCAFFTLIVRNCGLFNFGVHTMLVLLEVNMTCILICKTDVRYSIFGSILMVLLIFLGELVSIGVISLFHPLDQINALMQDPTFKAISAIPGNLVHMAIVLILYRLRVGQGGQAYETGR